jgi:hypothetical protein
MVARISGNEMSEASSTAPSTSTHRVFISHSSRDTWVARQIAAHIARTGADVFLDEADIEHGDDFDQKLVDGANTCTELLVLLTPWSKERPYVWIEIGMFRHRGLRIVGVLHGLTLEEVSTDPRMPALLKRLDIIEINDVDSYFEQLGRRVESTRATS